MENKLKIIKEFYNLNETNKQDLIKILSKLSKPYSINTNPIYEYSLNGQEKLKLLHLLFYKDIPKQEKKRIFQERKIQIKSLFNLFKNKNFDLNTLERVLNQANNLNYPLQIAFEFDKTGLYKIKLYFSNILRLEKNTKDSLNFVRIILDALKIPDNPNNKEMLGEGIDCIGIDFLKNRKTKFKIYTFYNKKFDFNKIKNTINNQIKKYKENQNTLTSFFDEISKLKYQDWGFLYRLSEKGKIIGVKAWYHLEKELPLSPQSKFKISYITSNGKYFRESSK